jgi:hypothetical protein
MWICGYLHIMNVYTRTGDKFMSAAVIHLDLSILAVEMLVLCALVLAYRINRGPRMVVTSESLTVCNGSRSTVIRWCDVKVFVVPDKCKGPLRRASIWDGERCIELSDLRQAEFDVLVHHATTAVKDRAPMMSETCRLSNLAEADCLESTLRN